MTVDNLAIVFGPSFLGQVGCELESAAAFDRLKLARESKAVNDVTIALIEHVDAIFFVWL